MFIDEVVWTDTAEWYILLQDKSSIESHEDMEERWRECKIFFHFYLFTFMTMVGTEWMLSVEKSFKLLEIETLAW